MMTLRARIFIILSVIVLLVLAVTLFLFVRNKSPNTPVPNVTTTETTNTAYFPNNTNTNNNQTTTNVPIVTNKPTVVSDPVAVEKVGVEQLARVFTERYQTFSSDNNYDNIKQVQTLVTDDLWKKLSTRLTAPPSKTFVGVTTDVFVSDVTSFGSGKATVVVQSRRTTEQNGKRSVANQNFSVDLIKKGSQWLVDTFSNAK